MKKTFMLFSVLLLALSFTACVSGDDDAGHIFSVQKKLHCIILLS